MQMGFKPMTTRVKYLSEDEIEKQTKLLLAEYEDTIGESIKLPVPIDDITIHHLALELNFADLHQALNVPMSRGNPDILGAIFVDKELVLIDNHLNPKKNPLMLGRYNFSVAHEIGHWRLHRSYVAKDPNQTSLFEVPSEPTVICRSSEKKEPIEWQADFFASCLLMPRNLLLELWRERFGTTAPFIFEINKVNPAFAARRSNWIQIGKVFEAREMDYQIVFKQIAREFAQVCCVSIDAMRFRLEKLELLLRDIPDQRSFAVST
jgi:Zn-dependent peptidase ImmA (M78 family)